VGPQSPKQTVECELAVSDPEYNPQLCPQTLRRAVEPVEREWRNFLSQFAIISLSQDLHEAAVSNSVPTAPSTGRE
jgi:hypothetical protein